MDNISVWIILAVVFFVIAAILLIVSVMLFVRLEIASVIGFLSGKTQKKQIQEIRAQAIKKGSYNKPVGSNKNRIDDIAISSNSSVERAIMQNEAHASKRLDNKSVENDKPRIDRFSELYVNESDADDTVSLGSKKHKQNDEKSDSEELPTELLNDTEKLTELLNESDNAELEEEGTAVLSSDSNASKTYMRFEVISDDTQVLTNEVIE